MSPLRRAGPVVQVVVALVMVAEGAVVVGIRSGLTFFPLNALRLAARSRSDHPRSEELRRAGAGDRTRCPLPKVRRV